MAATKRSARQRLDREFLEGNISPQDYIDHICGELTGGAAQWREDHMLVHTLEKRALDVAAEVVARQLEHLNQLRQDVISDRSMFVKKDMFDLNNLGNEKKFSAIDKKLAYFAGVVGAYGFLVMLFIAFHDHIFAMMGH